MEKYLWAGTHVKEHLNKSTTLGEVDRMCSNNNPKSTVKYQAVETELGIGSSK